MTRRKRSTTGLLKQLGRQVRELRDDRGWSQGDLAEKLGVEPETVSRIERGVAAPSLEKLEQLGKCFNVSLASLLEASSPSPDDQARRIVSLLKPLDERDRNLVLDVVRLQVRHLTRKS